MADKLVIAVPVEQMRLCSHFGHCSEFALFTVDRSAQALLEKTTLPAPPHQPGLLPGWLAEQGVNVVIAGGIGSKAIELFTQMGIEVVCGAPSENPEKIVQQYLADSLQTQPNQCDH